MIPGDLAMWLMVKNYLMQYIFLEATYLRSTACTAGATATVQQQEAAGSWNPDAVGVSAAPLVAAAVALPVLVPTLDVAAPVAAVVAVAAVAAAVPLPSNSKQAAAGTGTAVLPAAVAPGSTQTTGSTHPSAAAAAGAAATGGAAATTSAATGGATAPHASSS